MPLNHGRHNYEVCTHLYKNTEYNDWIVTTAYYSAIHFVYYKIFPVKTEHPRTGKWVNFNSFKNYCATLPPYTSKHQVTEELVSEYLPEIYEAFKTLKDTCWTARYDDYKVEPLLVKKCIQNIRDIKELCEEDL